MANINRVVVGRLIEVRLDSGVRTVSDVHDWFDGFAAAVATLPPQTRVVVAADWRSCPVLSTDAAECAVERLTKVNPRVERSAALASRTSATSVLQFLRLIRESEHPSRRLFTETGPMIAWLLESLTPAEGMRFASQSLMD
jgi:hypothetical protein